MRAPPLARTLPILVGLAVPLLSRAGAPACADTTSLPAVPPAGAIPASGASADSLDRRLRTLLSSDTLNLDSLERLLHEDTLTQGGGAIESTSSSRPPAIEVGAAPARPEASPPGASPRSEPHRAAVAPAQDSRSIRWELGAGTDLIDEQFYEYRDEVFDTLSRKQVSEPEIRVAGVFALAADGTRGNGRARWRVHDETSIGDLLQRMTLDADWRDDRSSRWRLVLSPWLDVRHDRTFGRDLNEVHGLGSARLERRLEGEASLALAVRGEVLRASGSGTDFLLDRDAVALSTVWERAPLFGDETRVGYALTVRQFPDSVVRDHLEHAGEASWRHLLGGSGWLGLELNGERRATREQVPSTRDNFWHGRAAGDLEAAVGEWGRVKARLDGEWLLYEVPDSLVYGDEHLLRAALLPGLRRGPGRSIACGPRFERLRSPQQGAEEYDQWAALAEMEWSTALSFWSATPAAGHRAYRQPLDHQRLATTGLHSSYDFAELGVIVDHQLPGSLRLRGFLDGRIESHTDSADDSRSLYFSLDLRMLF